MELRVGGNVENLIHLVPSLADPCSMDRDEAKLVVVSFVQIVVGRG
jgi:hypothetical protein